MDYMLSLIYPFSILLRLRQAAGPNTRLVLADFVLPLACVDEVEVVFPRHEELASCGLGFKSSGSALPGIVRTLAPDGSPLLPNLGKATAHAYWLDLTVRAHKNLFSYLAHLKDVSYPLDAIHVQLSRKDASRVLCTDTHCRLEDHAGYQS